MISVMACLNLCCHTKPNYYQVKLESLAAKVGIQCVQMRIVAELILRHSSKVGGMQHENELFSKHIHGLLELAKY